MKSLDKKGTIDPEQIASEFISPMDNYESCEVESYKEAEQEFDQISQDLQIETDWKIKCQAIDHLIELYKGGIQYFPEGDLKCISQLIAQCILNMRTLMVRKSSILVAVVARLLKEDFEAAALNIIPALLKQCSSKNQVIGNYCHCSLLHVIQFCPTKNVGQLVISNYTSRSRIVRQISAECCHIILETWPQKISSALDNDIQMALTALETDPNESIRTIATQAESFESDSPKKKLGESSLPFAQSTSPSSVNPSSQMITLKPKKEPKQEITQEMPNPKPQERTNPKAIPESKDDKPKRLKKDRTANENIQQNEVSASAVEKGKTQSDQIDSRSINSQSARKEDIPFETVLNPSNKKGAALFKLILDTNLQLERYDNISSLDQRDFVSSLIYSLQQIPDFSAWKNDLKILLDHFPNYFTPYVINIMSIFSFDPDVYELLADTYTAQSMAEMFVSGRRQRMSDAFNFFVVAFKTKTHQIELSEKMKSALQIIIRANPINEDTQILKDAVEQYESGPTINELTHRILVELATNEDYQETLDALAEYNDSTEAVNTIIESKFSAEIPKLLSEGTQVQKRSTIKFIIECAGKLKKVSFQTAVEPLIGIALHGKSKWEASAIDAIGKLMQDIKVLALSLNLLASTQNEYIIIESMQKYFKEAPPNRLITVQKVIVDKLKPYLSCEKADIRKGVIQIFASFKEKIPKEFGKLMKKEFNPTQRRLIDMNAQKSSVVK